VALDEGIAPPAAQAFGSPPVDVAPLYEPTPDYVVLGMHQTERFPPDGRVIPCLEVSFTVPGMPGRHTIIIDNYAFTHADVLGYLRGRASLLRRIMALPTMLPASPEEV